MNETVMLARPEEQEPFFESALIVDQEPSNSWSKLSFVSCIRVNLMDPFSLSPVYSSDVLVKLELSFAYSPCFHSLLSEVRSSGT